MAGIRITALFVGVDCQMLSVMSQYVSASSVMYSLWWERIWLLRWPVLLHCLQHTKSSMHMH